MKIAPRIRDACSGDNKQLSELAVSSGLFPPDGLGELHEMLDKYFANELPEHSWIVLDNEGAVEGAAYFAPEIMTDGTWNLYFIAVAADRQGGGGGGTLLKFVEQTLRERGARVLIVETSGLDNFDLTRTFYRKHGYSEEARIREFYAPGDDKIVFWKSLNAVT